MILLYIAKIKPTYLFKMQFLTILFLFIFQNGYVGDFWNTNLDKSLTRAKQEHKYILLNFSGSDWCGPCIRMHKELFNTPEFQTYSSGKLIMVNLDFPRQKKNQPSPEQQGINERGADRYNPKGYFPYTLLLDERGNILRSWEGFYKQGTSTFISELESLIKN